MNRSTAAILTLAAIGAAAGVGAASRGDRPDDTAKLAKALTGYTPGAATSCTPIGMPVLTTETIGRTILYRRNGGELYRNDTAGGCEGAAHGDILVSVEHEGRPCSGDIIRTVEPGSHITTGSCSLGQFVMYKKTPR